MSYFNNKDYDNLLSEVIQFLKDLAHLAKEVLKELLKD